jgi:hypothetical protein
LYVISASKAKPYWNPIDGKINMFYIIIIIKNRKKYLMPGDCKVIRVDKNMRPNRRPFDQLGGNHGHESLIASANAKEGSGPYEVHVWFKDPQGRWRSGSFSTGRSLRADISPTRGFTPTVEVENKSNDHLELTVCLNY